MLAVLAHLIILRGDFHTLCHCPELDLTLIVLTGKTVKKALTAFTSVYPQIVKNEKVLLDRGWKIRNGILYPPFFGSAVTTFIRRKRLHTIQNIIKVVPFKLYIPLNATSKKVSCRPYQKLVRGRQSKENREFGRLPAFRNMETSTLQGRNHSASRWGIYP